MNSQLRIAGSRKTDTPTSLVRLFRDNIATRCRHDDIAFPAGGDLEASTLDAIHGELHGQAALLCGTHSPDNWRERIRGEKVLPVGDLCRLITTPCREARAASVAALTVLARAAGYRLEVAEAPAAPLVDSATQAARIATDALGEVARAVADGHVDVTEAASIRRQAALLRESAAELDAAAGAAEGRR